MATKPSKHAAKTAAAPADVNPFRGVGTEPTGEAPAEAPTSDNPSGEAPKSDAGKPAIPRTRGPRGTSESDEITVNCANPKRPGSKAEAAFACYKSGMTIAEFCDAVDALGEGHKGTATGHLVYDTKHGFITIAGFTPVGGVTPPKPKAPAKPKAEKKAKATPAENAEAKAETAAAEAEKVAAVEAATTEETMD